MDPLGPGQLLANGYRLARRAAGGTWIVTHRTLPGRCWLLVPQHLPGPGMAEGMAEKLAFLGDHPGVEPEVDRVPWTVGSHRAPGTAALYAFDGARLLAEIPAPLPLDTLRSIARTALSVLDAAARAGVSLGPISAQRLLWRAREASARHLLHTGPEGSRVAAEAALAQLLVGFAAPSDQSAAEALLRAARQQEPLSHFVDDPTPAAPPSSDFAAISSIGCVRAYNEDAVGWAPCATGGTLYAVVDGAGAMTSGEEVTRAALAALLDAAVLPLTDPREVLEEGYQDAWRAVEALGVPGSATACAAIVRGRTVCLAHVGDVRAYRVSGRSIEPLTRDHTLAERMLALGRLSPAEARTHSHGGIVLRAITPQTPAEVDQLEVELDPGERLLLCTDGLWRTLGDEAMAAILSASPDPRRAVASLHEAALAAGAPDNLALVLVAPE